MNPIFWFSSRSNLASKSTAALVFPKAWANSRKSAKPTEPSPSKSGVGGPAVAANWFIRRRSIAFASFSGGGGHAERGSADGYVEGLGIQVDMEGDTHVDEGTNVDYQTSPPASGDHWRTPAPCGFYEEGLPDERVVHNMEHGNIVVNYNLPLASDVSALRDALNGIGLNRVWGIARAYDAIPTGQVALSTWGIIDTFVGVDPDRISRFFDAYSGSGPEGGIPC